MDLLSAIWLYAVKRVLERGRAAPASATASWAEVWTRTWRAIDHSCGIGEDGLTVPKVKNHAAIDDVAAGRVTGRAKRGSMEADRCVSS